MSFLVNEQLSVEFNFNSFIFSIHFVHVRILRYQDFEVSPLSLFINPTERNYNTKIDLFILKAILWQDFISVPSSFYNLPFLSKMASSHILFCFCVSDEAD